MVAIPDLDVTKLPLLLGTRSSIGNGTSKSELERCCQGISNFKGVFMQDEKLPNSGCFIMNLDRKSGKGTHWVAVSYDCDIYFDPFGIAPPDKINVKYYNSFEIQHAQEDLCGEYCIWFLKHVSGNMSVNYKLLLSMIH
jgi:hypothetical protein